MEVLSTISVVKTGIKTTADVIGREIYFILRPYNLIYLTKILWLHTEVTNMLFCNKLTVYLYIFLFNLTYLKPLVTR